MRNIDPPRSHRRSFEAGQLRQPAPETGHRVLVSHLHDFAREVELTEAEWMQGIEFLTATGHKCNNTRQEFILLSDTLGLSMLVVALDNAKPLGATEATVFGPFHVDDAPTIAQGADMARGAPECRCS